MKIIQFWLFTIVSVFLISGLSQAQIQQPDSTKHVILPGAGYDSDGGLAVSLVYQLLNYDLNNPESFRHLLRMQAGATLGGNLSLKNEYEYRSQRSTRLNVTLLGERISSAYYFGIGSDSEFKEALWDDGFYDYMRWYILSNIEHAIPIQPSLNSTEFWLYGWQFEFLDASEKTGSLLDTTPPELDLNTWFNNFYVGFISDHRNSSFRPSDGYNFKTSLSLSPSLVSSSSTFLKFEAVASHYLDLKVLNNLVLASRLGMRQIMGTAPFIATPFLGGQYDLRGYPLERFRDSGVAFYNAELRSWLFRLPFWEIQVGGNVFFDGGWIYEQPFSVNFKDDHKWSFGIGGVVSIFNPDFITRGDIGFSKEIWRISVGVGYLF